MKLYQESKSKFMVLCNNKSNDDIGMMVIFPANNELDVITLLKQIFDTYMNTATLKITLFRYINEDDVYIPDNFCRV